MMEPCRNSRMLVSFFFQAEDGIRDDLVTGVQTCALPISLQHGGFGNAGSRSCSNKQDTPRLKWGRRRRQQEQQQNRAEACFHFCENQDLIAKMEEGLCADVLLLLLSPSSSPNPPSWRRRP